MQTNKNTLCGRCQLFLIKMGKICGRCKAVAEGKAKPLATTQLERECLSLYRDWDEQQREFWLKKNEEYVKQLRERTKRILMAGVAV